LSIPTGSLVLRVRGEARLAVPDLLRGTTTYVLLEQEDWFEEEIRFVRRCLRPRMRAVDAGAAYGVYTIAMAKAVGAEGRVWAFEATARTAEFLEFNLQLNELANTKVLPVALSDHCGRVTFSVSPDTETNAVGKTAAPGGQTLEVEAITLDEAAARHAWGEVDFLKLDVEGHELEVIAGGRRFLRERSPIVMVEICDGDGRADLRALSELSTLGYEPYRLLPGPLLLTSFDGDPRPSQLNLFACKKDRAARLAQQGLLAPDSAVEPISPPANAWDDYLARAPYARGRVQAWRADPPPALAAFAGAQRDGLSAAERVGLLTYALQDCPRGSETDATLAQWMTYARLAWELGEREEAVGALRRATEDLAAGANLQPDEPFLATSRRYEQVGAGGDPAAWAKCAIVEQYERLRHFSSRFAPQETRRHADALAGLPQRSPEIERRRLLTQILAGSGGALQVDPCLLESSEENLNAEFWSRLARPNAQG
jgi:FkbM family methyltransferase